MGSEGLKGIKVCRDLLRTITKYIGNEGHKRHFREFVLKEFEKNSNLSDKSVVQGNLKAARDYTILLKSVHENQSLLLSYNIGLDRSEEMKRNLKNSAASVGLQLPDVYTP